MTAPEWLCIREKSKHCNSISYWMKWQNTHLNLKSHKFGFVSYRIVSHVVFKSTQTLKYLTHWTNGSSYVIQKAIKGDKWVEAQNERDEWTTLYIQVMLLKETTEIERVEIFWIVFMYVLSVFSILFVLKCVTRLFKFHFTRRVYMFQLIFAQCSTGSSSSNSNSVHWVQLNGARIRVYVFAIANSHLNQVQIWTQVSNKPV